VVSVAGRAVFLAANRAAAGNSMVLLRAPVFRRPGERFLGWGRSFCFGVVSHFCRSCGQAGVQTRSAEALLPVRVLTSGFAPLQGAMQWQRLP